MCCNNSAACKLTSSRLSQSFSSCLEACVNVLLNNTALANLLFFFLSPPPLLTWSAFTVYRLISVGLHRMSCCSIPDLSPSLFISYHFFFHYRVLLLSPAIASFFTTGHNISLLPPGITSLMPPPTSSYNQPYLIVSLSRIVVITCLLIN